MEEWLGQISGTYGDIISFISPCALPMVPAYLGYLSGAALNTRKQ